MFSLGLKVDRDYAHRASSPGSTAMLTHDEGPSLNCCLSIKATTALGHMPVQSLIIEYRKGAKANLFAVVPVGFSWGTH